MNIKEFKQWWNRFEYSGNFPEPKAEHINLLLADVDRLTAELAEKKAECERLKSDFAYVEKCFKCTEGCLLDEKNAEVTRLESLAASRLADHDSYRDAVEDALVVANIGVASGDAKADLHKLICWEIDVALDPRVSKRAADLIAEKVAEVERLKQSFSDISHLAAARLADQEAIERHVTRRVAREIVRYLRKEWPFMGAGAVMDIKERYGVE